jgi:hypothetical protein
MGTCDSINFEGRSFRECKLSDVVSPAESMAVMPVNVALVITSAMERERRLRWAVSAQPA